MYKCFAGSHPAQVLRQGDLLLAVDGKTIVSLSDLEKHCMFRKQVCCSEMNNACRSVVFTRISALC